VGRPTLAIETRSPQFRFALPDHGYQTAAFTVVHSLYQFDDLDHGRVPQHAISPPMAWCLSE